MEAKKTVKFISILAVAAVLIFSLVIYFNSRIESREKNAPESVAEVKMIPNLENQQSFVAANMPLIEEGDFVSPHYDDVLNVVVYEDYADLFSAEFSASLTQAQVDFKEQINIAYRPFNVSNSDLSRQAAIAVRCAADVNQGEHFRSKVFSTVRENKFSADSLMVIAEGIGLNKEEFQVCLTNLEKKEKIEQLIASADNFSVYGAPTVFVGDEMVVGARPYETFIDSNGDEIEGLKQVIERQLK